MRGTVTIKRQNLDWKYTHGGVESSEIIGEGGIFLPFVIQFRRIPDAGEEGRVARR